MSFDRITIDYSDGKITLPDGYYKRKKELYISVVKGALYVKSKWQYARFMNGARRSRDPMTVDFYNACCNTTVVLPYVDNKIEVTTELASVLNEDEPCEMIDFKDSSGLIIGTKSFFDSKLNK